MDFLKTENWDFASANPIIVAGPCSAESEEQVLAVAKSLSEIKVFDNKPRAVDIFRAGIWKPRTRPNSFEGVGDAGLKWLTKVKSLYNFPVAVEAATPRHIELCLKNKIDVLWIGARTTVNPFLVQEIAEALNGVDIPVMIKNPINPDIELWIGAIERIYNIGIKKIIAVHRGFSSFEKSIYRNKPNWEIPIELKRRFPNLPLICDPSHICGNTENIPSICQKAIDMSFDGLMVEVHPNPEEALSDKAQQVTPEDFENLLNKLILRKPTTDDILVLNTLEKLREHIDKIDFNLLELLAKRMSVVEKIGQFKKENNITILQPERWNEIVLTRTGDGETKELSRKLVLKIFELIHDESIRKQTEIMNKKEEEKSAK